MHICAFMIGYYNLAVKPRFHPTITVWMAALYTWNEVSTIGLLARVIGLLSTCQTWKASWLCYCLNWYLWASTTPLMVSSKKKSLWRACFCRFCGYTKRRPLCGAWCVWSVCQFYWRAVSNSRSGTINGGRSILESFLPIFTAENLTLWKHQKNKPLSNCY